MGDARVVSGQVEPSKLVQGGIHHGLAVVLGRYVTAAGKSLHAVRFQVRHQLVQRGHVDVAEHQPGATLTQLRGQAVAEATGGPGDQCHLAGEIQHRVHIKTPFSKEQVESCKLQRGIAN